MKKRNLSLLRLLILVSFALFTSCTNDNNSQDYNLEGKYTHSIVGCDNNGNAENNCVEFIDFIDNSNVDVLIGGGDIVYRTKYTINDNKVQLDKISGLNFDISYNIQNESTLNRIEDSGIWVKTK